MNETTPKKPNILLRLLALLVTIALILGALVLVVYRDRINLDALERWLTYRELEMDEGGQAVPFTHAGGEHMERLLDITPGSLSVLGLMNDREKAVRLLIDRELLGEAYIGVHPCVNTSSLKLRLSDLLEKFLPAVDHGYTVVDLEG